MGLIEEFFINPIYQNTGYNIVNTSVYAVLLIAAVFLTYTLIKKLDIKIDRNFFIGVVPFIAMGGILRAYEDLAEATSSHPGIFQNFIITDAFGIERNLLFVSPIIYFTVFLIALAALIVSIYARRSEYWKVWFAAGAIIDIVILSQLRFVSVFALVSIGAITIFWILLLIGARAFLAPKNEKLKRLLTWENIFLISVHMFEAATTFVALQFPEEIGADYFEQHVVAGFFINSLGPWSFFLLKLAVVPVVLYYFDKEMTRDENEKRIFFKIIVLILGLGPGLRNFLRLLMVV